VLGGSSCVEYGEVYENTIPFFLYTLLPLSILHARGVPSDIGGRIENLMVLTTCSV
jgi:hypothetical protein